MNRLDIPGSPSRPDGRRARSRRAGGLVALAITLAVVVVLPGAAHALDFWVDGVNGSDARPPIQAQSKATPWKTIVHALETVTAGHVIHVRPGTYAEKLESKAPGVSLVADGPPDSVVVQSASGVTGLLVNHADLAVTGFAFRGGLRGVRSIGAARLVLRDVSVAGHSGDGVVLETSPDATVERVSVTGGGEGLVVIASPRVSFRDASVAGHSGDGVVFDTSAAATAERVSVAGGGGGLVVTASPGIALVDVAVSAASREAVSIADSGGATLDRLDVDGGTHGIRFLRCPDSSASDAALSGQSQAGLSLEQSPRTRVARTAVDGGVDGFLAAASDGASFEDVSATGLSGVGISVTTCAGAVVERASIEGGTGGLAADGCANLQVADFVATGVSGAGAVVVNSPGASLDGIALDGAANGLRISGSDRVGLRGATVERVPGVAVSISGSTSAVIDGAVLRSVGAGVDVVASPEAILRAVEVSGVVGVGASLDSSASARVEDCSFDEGSYGLRVRESAAILVLGVRATGQRVAGIAVADSADTVVANSIVRDCGDGGILVERGVPAYVRNNLVADCSGWGISVDDSALPAPGAGHVLSFNTVVRSGATLGAGGLRLANAVGEVRDNLLADNSPVGLRIDTPGALVHHDLVWGSPEPISPEAYGIGGGMVFADPGFASSDPDRPFALSQVAAGQAFDSPAVDAGSAGVVSRDIGGSTRTDLAADEDFADLGFHAGAPAPEGAPLPFKPTTLWVNCATGDDLRGRGQADSSLFPLRTISRALSIAVDGDRIVVQDGTCNERATIDVPGIGLEAENVGGVVIEAPADQAAIRVRASRVNVSGFVVRSDKEGVVVAAKNSATRLMLVRVRNLRVEGAGGGPEAFVATNGIRLTGIDRSRVESCEVRGALQQGIVARDAGRMWIRNNLVVGSGEWGIHVDNGDARPAIPSGNVVLFNTVVGSAAGGIRFQRATGEIGWNISAYNVGPGIKVDDAPVWIHHANLFENALPIFSEPASPPAIWSLVPGDPAFVDRAGGNFALGQVAAGQASDSPAVDAAGVKPGKARIKGSTRSDGVADSGDADLGWHATRKKLGSRPVLVVPPDDGPRTVHVDGATGDDARAALDAVDPATPWRTIARALRADGARTGDTVRIAAGTYDGGLATVVPGVTLRATGAVVVVAPADGAGLSVGHADTVVEGIRFESGRRGVVAGGALRLVLRDVAVAGTKKDAIVLDASEAALLERVHVEGGNALVRVSASADVVVRDLDAGDHEDEGVVLANAARALVERVTVAGGRTVVDATNSPGLVVRDLSASAIRGDGISLSGCSGAHLERVTLGARDAGLRVASSADLVVSHLSASGHADEGVIVSGSDRASLSDLQLSGGLRGMVLSSGAGMVVERADVDGARGALVADAASGLVVRDLTATGLVATGVSLANSPDAALERVSTAGGEDGLAVGASPRLSVSSFDASGHSGAGVRLDGSADGHVEDVTIEGGATGLEVSASPGLAVARLQVSGAGVAGVQVAGSASSILEDVAANELGGDGVSLGTSPGSRIERVRVTDVAGDAVAAEASAEVTVRDLEAAGHAGSAVRLSASPDARVEDVTSSGGTHGVRGDAVDRVVVRNSSFTDPSTDGILLSGSIAPVVDDVVVEGAGGSGISIVRAQSAYVRNNRVARVGEWGISIDDSVPPAPPASDGQVVAFNTVWQSARLSATSGGIRFASASGEIRDNVVVAVGGSVVKTDLAPTVVHHNVLFGGARIFDSKSGQEPVRRANRVADPLLVDPAASDFALRQVAAGQGEDSPARDAGSGTVATLDIGGSTRTDAVADAGLADAGWHAAAAAAGTPPAIAFVSPPGLGNTLHVDPAAGDDDRGYDVAQDGTTPVRSVRRAMALAVPGDVVLLGAGTYPESIEVLADGVVLRGTDVRGAVVVQPPDGETGIQVAGHDDVTVENLVVEGGSRGVLATDSDRLRLFRVGSVVPEFVGLEVRDGADAVVDSCFATSAGSHGIQLRRASGYLRNNLSYANGEWGISVDASGLSTPLSGLVVAFNTVHANQDGIRMVNAGGEVRDNLLTEQVDLGLYLAGPNLLAHHNDFSANGRDRDQESAFADTIRVWASIDGNPRYRDPSGPDDVLGLEGWQDDDFRLRQLPGETPASPMVDAGSGPVSALDVGGTTRSDGVPDSGTADLGFHVDAPPATVPPPFATPPTDVSSTYYVSSATGFDGRSSASAKRRETPWATIGRALQAVLPGDSIVVLPGRYAETVQVSVADVSVVSETPRAAVVAPASGNGVSVEADDVKVSGFVVEAAPNNGVSVLDGADRVEIRGCALVRSRANGLLAKGVSGLVVQDVVAVSSGQSGIVLRNTTGSTLRDVLSYENAEWGANVNSVVAGVVSGGHLVERSTFAFNALGDLRFAKASGTIRDNLLTNTPGVGLRIDTAGSTLLHNGFFAAAQEMDPATYILAQCAACSSNRVLDPAYVDPDGADGVRGGTGWADDDFRLSQTAAGQATQSEAVDAGSVEVDSLGPVGSTRTDGEPDAGTLDLGVHR